MLMFKKIFKKLSGIALCETAAANDDNVKFSIETTKEVLSKNV